MAKKKPTGESKASRRVTDRGAARTGRTKAQHKQDRKVNDGIANRHRGRKNS